MHNLTPHLFVADMPASIAFYRDVLSFTVNRAHPEEAPTFASLERPGANLMLSPYEGAFEDWAMMAAARGRRGQGGAVSFYIESSDVDREFAHVQECGATIVDALVTQPWGQREFTVADPDGFWWAIWQV